MSVWMEWDEILHRHEPQRMRHHEVNICSFDSDVLMEGYSTFPQDEH